MQCCVRQSELAYQGHRLFCLYQRQRLSCLYQRQRLFLFIPALLELFIKYTSAPVEVSVWLGGKALKSVFVAFCVQDAVKDE